MRKWPGGSASIPSSASGTSISGLEFSYASIRARTIVSSSNVSFTSPTIHLKYFFMLLTAAFHKPPNVVHAQEWISTVCLVWCRNHQYDHRNSWQFLPIHGFFWLLQQNLCCGHSTWWMVFPHWAMKWQSVAVNAAVVNSETGSRCIAFTDRKTNKATLCFGDDRLPNTAWFDPNQTSIVHTNTIKTNPVLNRSAGSWAVIWGLDWLVTCWQMTQLRLIKRIVLYPCYMWNRWVREAATNVGPA